VSNTGTPKGARKSCKSISKKKKTVAVGSEPLERWRPPESANMLWSIYFSMEKGIGMEEEKTEKR
jgi:hypothetical protein